MKKNDTDLLKTVQQNMKRAHEIIDELRIIPAWESVGAEVNLVGSLKTGLLLDNRDVDFHIYTENLTTAISFKALSQIAETPGVERIEYQNLLKTEEKCIEWHLWYKDGSGKTWKADMIHIDKKSTYAGYFEKVADRIIKVLTPETKMSILEIKNTRNKSNNPPSVLIYQAVLRDGIRTPEQFQNWLKEINNNGIVDWMP